MKHLLSWLLCSTLLLTFSISAHAEQTDEYQAKKVATRMMRSASKLKKQNQYIQAIDSATFALKTYASSQQAANFIHRHWGKMLRQSSDTIEHYYRMDQLEDVRRCLWVYGLLVEINDNLREITLPLHGAGNSWVWQPEIQYWEGHYSDYLKQEAKLEEQLKANEQ